MSAVAVAGIVSAGVGIAGAAGAFAPDSPDYNKITRDSMQAEIDLMPAKYEANAIYNPKYAALNSLIAWQNLFGTPATQETTSEAMPAGWYDASGNLISTQRNAFGRPFGRPGRRGEGTAIPDGYTWRGAWTKPGVKSTAATPGQLATMEAASPRLLALANTVNTNQRQAALNDVTTLAPQAMSAMRAWNPAVTGLLDTANRQVSDRLDANGALDPFLANSLRQQFRTGEAARGFAGGTNDAAMEAYYQTATQERRQLENLALAGQLAGVNSAYYGDPFQQVLARTSGSSPVPSVNYTAQQPNAVGDTSNAAAGIYNTQSQNRNGAFVAQQGYLGKLGTSIEGLGNGFSSLRNYFTPASGPLPTYGAGGLAY